MIIANFCQTAGNVAEEEKHVQMHDANIHTRRVYARTHTRACRMQEDGQLLIELS